MNEIAELKQLFWYSKLWFEKGWKRQSEQENHNIQEIENRPLNSKPSVFEIAWNGKRKLACLWTTNQTLCPSVYYMVFIVYSNWDTCHSSITKPLKETQINPLKTDSRTLILHYDDECSKIERHIVNHKKVMRKQLFKWDIPW